jgi:hypothetical protein
MTASNHHKNAEKFLNISLAMYGRLDDKKVYVHSNNDFDEQKTNMIEL